MKLNRALLISSLLVTSFQMVHADKLSDRIRHRRDARQDRFDAMRERARRPTPTPTGYSQSLALQGKTGTVAEKLYHLLKDQYDGRNDHGVTELKGTLSLANTPNDKVECTAVLPATSDMYRCRIVSVMRSGASDYVGGRTYQNVVISSGLLFNSVAGKLFRLIYNALPSAVSAQDAKTDYFQIKIAEPGDAKSPNSLTCELEGVPAPVALDVRKVHCNYRGIERPGRYYP